MKSFIWLFALLITASAAYYQQQTGPTRPVKTVVSTGMQHFPVVFVRSHSGRSDCPVVLRITDITVSGVLVYRRVPSKDAMTKVVLKREGDKLMALLPNQPPAGNLEYHVELQKNGTPLKITPDVPVVIRFKGDIPRVVLLIHVILMYLAILFSVVTGFYALFKIRFYKFFAAVTGLILFTGGLISGPIIQKYAFNEWWAGLPFGWNLTDNKTLIAVLFWLMALEMIRKKHSAFWVVVASLVTIVVYFIPHSLFGSQLNPETGKIIQGSILPFLQRF